MIVIYLLFFLVGMFISSILHTCIWNYIEHKINKVHFYLTRDKNYCLKLWFDKPKRDGNEWIADYSTYSAIIAYGGEIEGLGLHQPDYDNLTWDDEPLEVFINCDNL